MYQELHKWDDALRVAEAKVGCRCNLSLSYAYPCITICDFYIHMHGKHDNVYMQNYVMSI